MGIFDSIKNNDRLISFLSSKIESDATQIAKEYLRGIREKRHTIFFPGLGRATAYEGNDKINGKDYSYVAFNDYWDNPGASGKISIGGKVPEIFHKVYFDPETKQALNPQPQMPVDSNWKSYIDKMNSEYSKTRLTPHFKYNLDPQSIQASIASFISLVSRGNAKKYPLNVNAFYAKWPAAAGSYRDVMEYTRDTVNGNRIWDYSNIGKELNNQDTSDLESGIRRELWGLQLGVPLKYRPEAINEHVLQIGYEKPLGHTGKGDAPYYWKFSPEYNQEILDHYMKYYRDLPKSIEELDEEKRLYKEAIENKSDSVETSSWYNAIRPKDYSGYKDYVTTSYGDKKTEEVINLINDISPGNNHWYTPGMTIYNPKYWSRYAKLAYSVGKGVFQ